MSIHDIDPKTVQYKRDDDALIVVDVREPDEFDAGHIEGAINLPLSAVTTKDIDALRGEAKPPIVLHCLGGKRSKLAADKLKDQGFSDDLYNLVGGYKAWVDAGLPVKT